MCISSHDLRYLNTLLNPGHRNDSIHEIQIARGNETTDLQRKIPLARAAYGDLQKQTSKSFKKENPMCTFSHD